MRQLDLPYALMFTEVIVVNLPPDLPRIFRSKNGEKIVAITSVKGKLSSCPERMYEFVGISFKFSRYTYMYVDAFRFWILGEKPLLFTSCLSVCPLNMMAYCRPGKVIKWYIKTECIHSFEPGDQLAVKFYRRLRKLLYNFLHILTVISL